MGLPRKYENNLLSSRRVQQILPAYHDKLILADVAGAYMDVADGPVMKFKCMLNLHIPSDKQLCARCLCPLKLMVPK